VSIVLAENTNSDIDVVSQGFTNDLEDNNANNILGFGSKQANAGGSLMAAWQYVSGTNFWGAGYGFIVPALPSATSDGIWNTDLWGGGITHEFVSFKTQPSAGAGHVVQLELRNTTATAAQVKLNGTVGIHDSVGMDSTVLPYREKGLR
jgi:hypothetical protein